LHVNVLYDDPALNAKVESVTRRIFRHALDLGGTLSGEHGIGIAKRQYMNMEQSASVLNLQRELKRVFDPLDLMNPGKVIP
jgi:glycolate oxidase